MLNEYVIEAEALRKSYGASPAVVNLNLRVARGSIYGFLGRNGAGKTTTIKILLGMTHADGGSARVLGRLTGAQDQSVEIRRRTGYVSEDKGLYDYMTVGQMIAFARPFFPAWRKDLEEKYLRLFELPLDRKVRALSKGMRTKLALLLALARGAELLILDEPTEGLDPSMIEEVLAALTGLAASEEMTIFFSSHQIAEVEQVADRVAILERGSVAVEGALDDLKDSYRRINFVFEDSIAPDAKSFDAPNIISARGEGRWLSLVVNGDAERIVDDARTRWHAVSTEVQRVGLKEIFLENVRKTGDRNQQTE